MKGSCRYCFWTAESLTAEASVCQMNRCAYTLTGAVTQKGTRFRLFSLYRLTRLTVQANKGVERKLVCRHSPTMSMSLFLCSAV
jgi:hypothetical protein